MAYVPFLYSSYRVSRALELLPLLRLGDAPGGLVQQHSAESERGGPDARLELGRHVRELAEEVQVDGRVRDARAVANRRALRSIDFLRLFAPLTLRC